MNGEQSARLAELQAALILFAEIADENAAALADIIDAAAVKMQTRGLAYALGLGDIDAARSDYRPCGMSDAAASVKRFAAACEEWADA